MSYETRFTICMNVVPFLSGAARLMLCQSHAEFRTFLAPFIKGARAVMKTQPRPGNLHNRDRKVGLATVLNRRDLCELAHDLYQRSLSETRGLTMSSSETRELTMSSSKTREFAMSSSSDAHVWTNMLALAAARGNRELCLLARRWDGWETGASRSTITEHDPKNAPLEIVEAIALMLESAAIHGHHDICLLAFDWYLAVRAASVVKPVIRWERMLHGAAFGGNIDLCDLAHKWSDLFRATDKKGKILHWEWMFDGAAQMKDSIRAREIWMAAYERLIAARQTTYWNNRLKVAARNGHCNLCLLAIQWGTAAHQHISYNDMIICAVQGVNHARACEICILAHRETTEELDINRVLRSAALHGNEKLCYLAYEWGATAFDQMLNCAASGGHIELCRLARTWYFEHAQDAHIRLLDYNTMFRRAAVRVRTEICQLAREWGATIDQP